MRIWERMRKVTRGGSDSHFYAQINQVAILMGAGISVVATQDQGER